MNLSDFTKNNYILQPKANIVDHINHEYSNNILTPDIYSDIDLFNKIKKGQTNILLRSEHPQELNGDSGVLESYNLEDLLSYSNFKPYLNQIKNWKSLFYSKNKKLKIIKNIKDLLIPENTIKNYSQLKHIDPDEFKSEISFSNWEYIQGSNGMIVADDVVKNKYHIIITDDYNNFYSQIENGFIKKEFLEKNIYNKVNIEKLIGMYESLLDKKDCAIIEFQIKENKPNEIYFLQYHKCREFSPANFNLDRELESGEIQSNIVRGKTPKEGIEVKLNYEHSEKKAHFMEVGYSNLENEINCKSRDVQIYGFENDLANEIAYGHSGRSLFFKPKLSLGIDMEKLFSDEDYDLDDNLRLRIISDGNKAYIKKI